MLYCKLMENEMATWLSEQLRIRGWSMREFARRIGKSHTAISDIANGEMNPSPETCRLIAEELDKPPALVFRKAGLLPSEPDDDPNAEEALHLFRQMTPTQRQITLTQMRALVRRERITERRRGTPTG